MIAELLDKYCRKLTPGSNIPVTFNESMNLSVEVWDQQFQRWEYEWESIGVTELLEQRLLWAELNRLKNGAVEFEWVIPLFNEPLGLADTNPNVFDTSSGAKKVQIDHNSGTDVFLQVGDSIRFSNHSKVYMVMAPVTGFNPFIELNCPLKVELTSTETVQTSNVAVTLIMEPGDEPIEYPREAGDFDTYYSAKFVEKI